MKSVRARFYEIEHYFMSALSLEPIQFADGISLYINQPQDQLLQNSFFNFIYLHHLVCEDVLLEVKAYMESRCAHYSLIADERIGESLMTAAPLLGLKFDVVTTAMALDLDQYMVIDPAIDNIIKYVSHDLDSWIVPLQDAFVIHDIEIAKKYIFAHQRALNQKNKLYHFVLQENSHAITSLTLTLYDHLVRLDDIGTIKSHRGRGYAARIIHYALQFAQSKGAQYCFLEASKDGLTLYEKIGFQPIFNYYSFITPPN